MTNLSHIVEVALLLSIAFFAGCVIGQGLRRLTWVARPIATPIPAERIAAAKGRTSELVVAPTIETIKPSRRNGAKAPAAPTRAESSPAGAGTAPPPGEQHPAPPDAVPRAPASQAGEVWRGGPHVEPVKTGAEDASAATAPAAAETLDIEAAAMRAIEGASSGRPRRAARRTAPDPAAKLVGMPASAPVPPAAAAPLAPPVAPPVATLAPPPPETTPATPSLAQHGPADPSAAKAPSSFGRPELLAAPRPGGSDKLRKIKGIDLELESKLNELGIFHFDQLAAWDQKAVVWVDGRIKARGRITRDKWVEQAKALSRAGHTAGSRK